MAVRTRFARYISMLAHSSRAPAVRVRFENLVAARIPTNVISVQYQVLHKHIHTHISRALMRFIDSRPQFQPSVAYVSAYASITMVSMLFCVRVARHSHQSARRRYSTAAFADCET